jgi:succinate dehydrogenase hydrophobic anchor subunit
MYYKFTRYSLVIFLLISFILDFELFLITFIFLNIHLFLGLQSVLKDYVHQSKLKTLFNFFARLFLVFIFSLLLEIIF